MSSTAGSTDPASAVPAHLSSDGLDPSAKDHAFDEKLRLQLAIFEVTRDAGGKGLSEIREMLLAAFARHGVEPPPGTWVESVASSAFYGEPYIVDFPAAVAADEMVPAPNDEVRERLASQRQLQQEKLPAGIFPSRADWNIPGNEVSRGSTRTLSLTRQEGGTVLVVAALVAAAVVAVVAVRAGTGRRPTGSGPRS
ncbi:MULTISPECIES: hypothetical protein [unclassified Arthrobacter]|uniref:hypothetical protein n=1 Tax=unclassified Arthrobacter TaxID=235627 RepID=UPI001C845BE9|nr:hypothetical protein [Arthrobacter sp. MAHUQ-56]MBX7445075.1 hypothetical protein [Arthrobacter sp. MAHUQ-56]